MPAFTSEAVADALDDAGFCQYAPNDDDPAGFTASGPGIGNAIVVNVRGTNGWTSRRIYNSLIDYIEALELVGYTARIVGSAVFVTIKH